MIYIPNVWLKSCPKRHFLWVWREYYFSNLDPRKVELMSCAISLRCNSAFDHICDDLVCTFFIFGKDHGHLHMRITAQSINSPEISISDFLFSFFFRLNIRSWKILVKLYSNCRIIWHSGPTIVFVSYSGWRCYRIPTTVPHNSYEQYTHGVR
jgi:hypothetical protein